MTVCFIVPVVILMNSYSTKKVSLSRLFNYADRIRMFSMREEDKEESMMHDMPALDRIDSRSMGHS